MSPQDRLSVGCVVYVGPSMGMGWLAPDFRKDGTVRMMSFASKLSKADQAGARMFISIATGAAIVNDFNMIFILC